MAKPLNIGVRYWPNYYITGRDGNKKQYPVVVFYFNCDDPKVGRSIAGSGVTPGLKFDDKNSVVKMVGVDDYQKFVNGHGAFEKLINAYANFGYVYDISPKGRDALIDEVEQTIEHTLDDDGIKMINKGNNDFIDKIIEAMEKNINDPNFLNYVNSVGRINFVGADKIFNATRLSTKNAIMILSQWVNSGRQGAPTYLATKRQWKVFFNHQVKQGAKPLYAVRPNDVQSRSIDAVRRAYGIDDNAWQDARIHHSVDMLARDDQYGVMNNKLFIMENLSPYYDITDTELIPGFNEVYDFVNNRPINVDANADKEEIQKQHDDLIDAANKSDTKDDTEITQNITVYAKKVGDAALENAAQISATEAIRYLASNCDLVLRENDENKKNVDTKLIMALVMKRFGINEKQSDHLLIQGMNQTNSIKYGVNRQRFKSLASEFENIVSIIMGIHESVSNNTLMWVLNTLGISVEEYRAMPETEEEAMEMANNVTESFIRTFNKMIRG